MTGKEEIEEGPQLISQGEGLEGSYRGKRRWRKG